MLERTLEDICKAAGWKHSEDRAQVPLPGGRHQEVCWTRFEDEGDALVRLFSIIGPCSALNEARLMAALRLNANLRFGALAVLGTELAVVDTFLIADADPGELRASMHYLAKTADRYEHAIFAKDEH